MFTKWLTSFALLAVTATMAVAQNDDKSSASDPTGTWKWERDFNGNKIDYTLKLKSDEGKLTGTYLTIVENGGPGFSEPVKIDEGKLEGDKISFKVTRSFNDNEFTVHYSGKLVDNDKIAGSSTLDLGNGPQEFDWNAKRTVLAEDIVGDWKLKFETPRGVAEPTLTLKMEADKLGGIYHSTLFGDLPLKDVELKDGKLTFAVTASSDNGEFKSSYKADVRGNKVNGLISVSFGGQDSEISFEGTKVQSSPKDEAGGEPASEQ